MLLRTLCFKQHGGGKGIGGAPPVSAEQEQEEKEGGKPENHISRGRKDREEKVKLLLIIIRGENPKRFDSKGGEKERNG